MKAASYAAAAVLTNAVVTADPAARCSQRSRGLAPEGYGYGVNASWAGRLPWKFGGDGDLITAPLVVNHYLYVGSTSGTLFAVDAATGTQIWSDDSGASFEDPDAVADTQPLPGMAAAEDLLIVANSTQLVAYGQ